MGNITPTVLYNVLKVARGFFCNYLFRNKCEAAWYFQHKDMLRQEIQRVYNETGQIMVLIKLLQY